MADEIPKKTSGLAAMAVVPTNQALHSKGDNKRADIGKFKDLLGSIHDIAFPKGEVDDQTRLEWDNIEGEVLGEVLQVGILAGTPLVQIDHPFFHFATPEQCLNKTFESSLIEAMKKRQYILSSFCAGKENLNRLLISLKGAGRAEQVQMLQSLSLSLSEQERSDPLSKLRRIG